MELKASGVEMGSEDAKILLICEYRLVMSDCLWQFCDIGLTFVQKKNSS